MKYKFSLPFIKIEMIIMMKLKNVIFTTINIKKKKKKDVDT